MTELNDGLTSFVTEIRDIQQRWDDVTIVLTSEFGRTLIGNTGKNETSFLILCILVTFHFA